MPLAAPTLRWKFIDVDVSGVETWRLLIEKREKHVARVTTMPVRHSFASDSRSIQGLTVTLPVRDVRAYVV